MLTIQSNLKIQDLETLSKTLIKPDIINFGLSKVGGGYTDKIADKVIAKLSKLDRDKTIVIINDITLQMADKLLEAGYKNIYLAFGSFNKDGTVSKDKTVYNIMKAVIENNIKEKLNAISLEEIFNMKIDGIIANPPYGKAGANITKTIIDKIDFEDYINLLPINDYKKIQNLWQHASNFECLAKSNTANEATFNGANVTTYACNIFKTKVNKLSLTDFELSNYIDQSLNKYFKETRQRSHKAIDESTSWVYFNSSLKNTNTVLLDHRFIGNKHLAYSKNTAEYKWNVTKEANLEWLKQNISCPSVDGKLNKYVITFDTDLEANNFVNFIYSVRGFKFISKIVTACNGDSTKPLGTILPKVDWTRSWTVEEILADYGYTEDEIKAVMEDLKNFKGMDD